MAHFVRRAGGGKKDKLRGKGFAIGRRVSGNNFVVYFFKLLLLFEDFFSPQTILNSQHPVFTSKNGYLKLKNVDKSYREVSVFSSKLRKLLVFPNGVM